MKINITIATFFLINLFIINYAFAQEVFRRNSAYIEVGGNGIVYSLNYDRIIFAKQKIKLVPRLGLTYWPKGNSSTYNGLIVPLEVNALWAKRAESRNFIEAGVGLSLIGMRDYDYDPVNGNQSKNKFARVTTIRLGYRHQKPTGGFMYRVGLLAPIAQDMFSKSRVGDDIFLRLYAGFSLGYSF